MLNGKKFLICMMATAILGGCASSYSTALEQKLDGKTSDQKRTVLAQECSLEITKGLKKDDPANIRHFQKMKQICEEMTGKKIMVKVPRPPSS